MPGYQPCPGTGKGVPRSSLTFKRVGNAVVKTGGKCRWCGKPVKITQYDEALRHKEAEHETTSTSSP